MDRLLKGVYFLSELVFGLCVAVAAFSGAVMVCWGLAAGVAGFLDGAVESLERPAA